MDLNNCTNDCLFRYEKVLLMIPKFLLAVLTQFCTCVEHFSLFSKVTLRPFSSYIVVIGSPLLSRDMKYLEQLFLDPECRY